MWGRKKKQIVIPAFYLFLTISSNAQSTLSLDSLINEIQAKKVRYQQELDYTLSFSNYFFLNWHHDKNAGRTDLLQNLNYKFSVSGDSLVRFSGSFLHNLGVQSYTDSITKMFPDDNTLKTCFDIRIRKNFSFSMNSTLVTRILNGYDYAVDDSGRTVKTLNSSFCTPLTWTFSGGFSLKWREFGSLGLGLSAAKLTVIRDKSIFSRQKVSQFYGVPEGKDHLFEYGISMQFLADKEFFKRIKWNCDLLVFKNYTAPVDVTLKNNFGILVSRYLKLTIQTRIFYEEMVSRSIQLENLVTFGFYVHL